MFSKAVVQSGRFVQMPASAQALYFQLGMCADDDGAVEAVPVMRLINAVEDDLRLLVTKGYVKILNSDMALYIMDWNRNNTIRQDRYHESFYHDLIVQLLDAGTAGGDLPEGGIPTVNHMSTDGQQNVDQRLPEVRLGKGSIGKGSIGEGRGSAEGGKAPAAPSGAGHTHSRFEKPLLEDVKELFIEQGSTSYQAERFFNYYESNGWKVGRDPMKNWKAAARNWILRDRNETVRNSRKSEEETASMKALKEFLQGGA